MTLGFSIGLDDASCLLRLALVPWVEQQQGKDLGVCQTSTTITKANEATSADSFLLPSASTKDEFEKTSNPALPKAIRVSAAWVNARYAWRPPHMHTIEPVCSGPPHMVHEAAMESGQTACFLILSQLLLTETIIAAWTSLAFTRQSSTFHTSPQTQQSPHQPHPDD